jgi:hypothetical protein
VLQEQSLQLIYERGYEPYQCKRTIKHIPHDRIALQVVQVDGSRRNATGGGEYGWGDNPPQTFWCEMHQKASSLHAAAQLSLSRAVADETADVAGVDAAAAASPAELLDAARRYRAKAAQLEAAAAAAAAGPAAPPV